MNCRNVGQNCSIEDSNLSIPNNGSVDVIIFGKGIGESILIKSKSGDYILIDSFINDDTKRPICLDYFDKFKISYHNLKLIIITHWHNDHIKGLAEIIKNVGKDVKIVLNPIIKNDRYNDYLSKKSKQQNSDCSEFVQVMSLIEEYDINRIIALNNREIYCADKNDIALFALSPQDEEFSGYIDYLLTEKLPKENNYHVPDDNLLSIVVLMTINEESFLFAGDMETRSNEKLGWKAVINNYSKRYDKSSWYKVSHHGSITGDCDDIWNKLLQSKPISFTTLFNNCYLPTDEDIERLTKKSKDLYVIGNKSKRAKELEATFKKSFNSKEFYRIPKKASFIRMIINSDKTIKIEAVGSVNKFNEDCAT